MLTVSLFEAASREQGEIAETVCDSHCGEKQMRSACGKQGRLVELHSGSEVGARKMEGAKPGKLLRAAGKGTMARVDD